jgi:transposase
MISLSSSLKYYLYRLPCDMRKGPDRLCGLVREHMKKDPLSESIFIFVSRTGSQIRLLYWEGDGFGIYSKKLQEGVFEMPAIHTTENSVTLTSDELMLMLRGIVLRTVRKFRRYQHPHRGEVEKSVDENFQNSLQNAHS